MLIGNIFKDGRWWVAEVPLAGCWTQGTSRADAKRMIVDWFESMLPRRDFTVTVSDLSGGSVLVSPNDPGVLAAHVLKYQRLAHNMTLAQASAALGASSRNAYARYEQGRAVPTLTKFYELLRAVAPELTFILAAKA